MTTYRWNGDIFVCKKTGEPMDKPYEGQVCAPMVIPDTPEYRSPIDGRLIDGRAARREDLKRNDCVPYEPTSKKPDLELARERQAQYYRNGRREPSDR